jgi:hypothetical protein
MPLRRPSALLFSLLTIASFLVGATAVQAQLLGPVQPLPGLQAPGVGLPRVVSTRPLRSMDDLVRGSLALTRKLQIDALRRSEPRRVDVDPQGAPILRGEFLATGLSGAQLDAVRALGFNADRATPADATLGLDFVVLRDTRGRSTARAMRALQQAAPDAAITYQHLYLPAGGDLARATTSAAPSSSAPSQRVGLIDGGVDPSAPALARARIERHGCSTANPSRHGTAVAARLVAGDPDTLYAADLWCGDAIGGATSNLVDALAWMARERVAVINISLVGPDNPVLARAVQAMIARGHVLVGAVGNDGPAAPPLFPAAYPDVIGVSGVDARDRVLPESGSGDQVDFCASGIEGTGRNALRGTSFAAPIVARKAARLLGAPSEGAAAQVQQQLVGAARHLGAPGHDPRYGYGLLSP